MTVAYAVIGSGWGDEGKGLVTDYLCAQTGAGMVVRFNGGSQAGHTVVTPLGERHVFHHIGAGTYAGSVTFLSRFFVCNPMTFIQELALLPVPPKIYVDARCLVTTPYDMIINQLLENKRGDKRHGSCGVGVHETIRRCAHQKFETTVGMLQSRAFFENTLERIRKSYIPKRLNELKLPPDCMEDYVGSRQLDQDLNFAMDTFMSNINLCSQSCILHHDTVVFEGAQGLALDQNNKEDFPHVTHSNTGLSNVVQMCGELDIKILRPHYVTRCYSTRHGAGPLPSEVPALYSKIVDETNITHKYQGSLRLAPLDMERLRKRVINDWATAGPRKVRLIQDTTLVVTCTDHVEDEYQYVLGGLPMTSDRVEPQSIASLIALNTKAFDNCLCSNGPTREHVMKVEARYAAS